MPTTTTGYVAQFQWAPPDEPSWIDLDGLHPTPDAARQRLAVCIAGFHQRKHHPGNIRTGIAATQIVHRTITDTPCDQ